MKWPVEIEQQAAVVRFHGPLDQDPLPDLVALELSLAPPVRSIRLSFGPEVKVPVDRLRRLDYRCSEPQTFVKDLPHRHAVRISLTEKCNYRCFFCHEEGLQMEVVRHDADDQAFLRLIDQFAAQAYDDLTFTGGEPLLKPRQILLALDHMEAIGYLPDIKFVSNGRALRVPFVTRLRRYPGQVRFNISMHSLDPVRYRQVVHNLNPRGGRDELAIVQNRLGMLRSAGIPFKLNFVLLKGINTGDQDLADILSYAQESGAQRVKFLELLITRKLKHLYPYYYRLQALRDQLGGQLVPLYSGLRRTVYRYRDTPLEVELQSCTCSRGCNVCALNRDVNCTAELRYFPCFLNPQQGSDLQETGLAPAIAAGADDVSAMARHYGDHSPLIIRDHYLTRHETFFYYEIALADLPVFQNDLQHLERLDLQRHRRFTEYYFSDGSPAFADFEYVHKLAQNTYDHQAMVILQQHMVAADGTGRITTTFERDGQYVPSIDAYIDDMARGGFTVVLRAEWSIDYYVAIGQASPDQAISIGTLPHRATALVRANQPLTAASCPLRPLRQPVPAWLVTA